MNRRERKRVVQHIHYKKWIEEKSQSRKDTQNTVAAFLLSQQTNVLKAEWNRTTTTTRKENVACVYDIEIAMMIKMMNAVMCTFPLDMYIII